MLKLLSRLLVLPPRARKPFRSRTLVLERLEERVVPSTAHFAIIGDYGDGSAEEGSVATLVKSWAPDFIVTVGDNNYPSGAAADMVDDIGKFYGDYIYNPDAPLAERTNNGLTENKFFPVLGNHDWVTRSGTPALPTAYTDYFTLPGNERYYTFTRGPVQFFMLDSGDGSGDFSDGFEPDGYTSDSIQAQWLHSQLTQSTAPWKLVVFHHSPYTSGPHDNDTLMQWPFAAWGASAVFTGHDHHYERLNVGGLPYFIDGSGGAGLDPFTTVQAGSQVRYGADYGALRVDASDTSIQFQFINRAGKLIDTYTLNNSLPTVTVAATDAYAAAFGSDPGTFTFTRTGSTASALTVNFTVGGTATNGVDYTSIPTSVTIPAGSASTTVQIAPLDGTAVEPDESVVLTLAASSAYQVGGSGSATVYIADNGPTTLVPAGAVWKYLDNGSNQGTAWQSAGFNDTAWAVGPAQLGYGDGDEATVVSYGPNAGSKYITTYFRRSFYVVDPAAVTGLTLKLLRDDGAVVYINGTEVYRSNMPTGSISYTTLASNAVGGSEESTFFQASLNPGVLVAGTNVITVEIHQDSASSSDISFDLSLTATTSNGPPTVSVAATDGYATEFGSDGGVFTFTRTGSTTSALTVNFTVGGTATNGVDYTSIPTSVTIPAGPASVTVAVTPLLDTVVESDESVVLTLSASSAYQVGGSGSATVYIVDNTIDTLVPAKGVWKYLDNGSNQGTAWQSAGFNDTAWAVGPAQLGYGDGDEATVVSYGPNAGSKYITTYFRRSFYVANPAAVPALTLKLLRDDGAVVYINGTEVYRSNMPTGSISYTTLAPKAVEGSAESTFLQATLNPGVLVAGTNVIAVEIHQVSRTSSDISFDLALLDPPAPVPSDDPDVGGGRGGQGAKDDKQEKTGHARLAGDDGALFAVPPEFASQVRFVPLEQHAPADQPVVGEGPNGFVWSRLKYAQLRDLARRSDPAPRGRPRSEWRPATFDRGLLATFFNSAGLGARSPLGGGPEIG